MSIDECNEHIADEADVEDYDASCETEFGPQIGEQAWSAGDPSHPVATYRAHHRWRKALLWAGTVVGLGAMTALLVGIAGSLAQTDDHNSWPQGSGVPPTPAAQTPMSPEVPEPPMPPWTPHNVPDAQVITHDGEFLQTFHRAGFNVYDPATTVTNAHIICHNLAISNRATTVLFMYRSDAVYAGWTIPQIATMVDLSAQFYCPGNN